MKEKAVCLVSGGIDSPVACALVSKKLDVIPLHFCLFPLASEESSLRAVNIIKDLRRVVKFKKLIVYPWGKILETILESRKKPSYMCVLCRRAMFKGAEMLCERENAQAIATGESLGQKATQTLQNLRAASGGVKVPILRPLLGLDKTEIEQISREFGIWHHEHAGRCYAVPKAPTTRAKPREVDRLFEKLELSKVIKENFDRILEVKTFEEDFQEYLFGTLR
ncbi:MAG: hypothetical protein U9M97_02970 [Candidatus Hadarchaeota archaeon]|nr:hypothetical protein [Candidatus Hadarchaeota archaeon]